MAKRMPVAWMCWKGDELAGILRNEPSDAARERYRVEPLYSAKDMGEMVLALVDCRKAAETANTFTARLHYIRDRAMLAIAGEPMSKEWKSEHRLAMRQKALTENVELKERVEALEAENARLKAEVRKQVHGSRVVFDRDIVTAAKEAA